MLGSVAASFLAAAGRERALESALAAALTFKLCAEGASASGAAAKGLSSFRWAFMDALSRIGDDELEKALLPGERGERFAHVRP
jgi:hydroxyethylthiazole kinase-like sugar kinase family protein